MPFQSKLFKISLILCPHAAEQLFRQRAVILSIKYKINNLFRPSSVSLVIYSSVYGRGWVRHYAYHRSSGLGDCTISFANANLGNIMRRVHAAHDHSVADARSAISSTSLISGRGA
jgi:hypothetical protein